MNFTEDIKAISEWIKAKHNLELDSQDLEHIELTLRIVRSKVLSEVLKSELKK